MPAIIPACDITSVNRAAKCFACFSRRENLAAVVYFLEQRRAVLAGQAANTANVLRKNAACFCFPPDDMGDDFDAAVAQTGAIAAGAPGISTQTMAQIRAAINPFVNIPQGELRRMEILARCALNAYP